MSKTVIIAQQRHIDAPAVAAEELPAGWTPALLAAVEEGRISLRRAQHIANLSTPSTEPRKD